MIKRYVEIITGTICAVTVRDEPEGTEPWEIESMRLRESNGHERKVYFPKNDDSVDPVTRKHDQEIQELILDELEDLSDPITVICAEKISGRPIVTEIDCKGNRLFLGDLNIDRYPLTDC